MRQLGLGCRGLNAKELQAYETMEQAICHRRMSCDISQVSTTVDLMHVLQTLLGDHPDIIYFNKTTIRTVTEGGKRKILLEDCSSRKQTEKREEQLHKALEDAVWAIDKAAKNDREILWGISEYLQKHAAYDHAQCGHPDMHNAYGALVCKRAVCDGFSCAFAMIAQYFGFRCMVAEGRAASIRSAKEEHAWNIVEYEHDCYHVDVTWDVNHYAVAQCFSYDYMGLDDDEILIDHDWDVSKTPKCVKSGLSYYTANDLVVYSQRQAADLLRREWRRGNHRIRMKFSVHTVLPTGREDDIRGILSDMMKQNRIFSSYHYTWNENTRCLTVLIDDD